MSEWKIYKLGDISEKIGSGATPRGGKEAYLEFGDISLIRSQNVLDFSFSRNGLAYISEEQAYNLRNVIVEQDDVLLNITGDSVARVCQVPLEILPARVNQHVAIIRGKKGKLNQSFLKYYLLEPSFKRYILGLASAGATRNALTKVMIENFEIKAPKVDDQTQIASILSSLDNKIELNLQMNQTLESMAQAIFKEWFVNFNFPGFDGELVDGLPKGWKIKTILEICEVTDFVANGSFASLAEQVQYKSEPDYAILVRLTDYNRDFNGDFVYVSKSAYDFLSKSKLFGGEIIIANVGANAGNVFRAPYLNVRMTLGPNAIMIKNNIYSDYLYLYLTSKIGQHLIRGVISGSAQPKFNKTDFRKIKLLIPEDGILEHFNGLYSSLNEKLLTNRAQIRTLTQIRDSLLPKLMTGKIQPQP